MKTAKTKRAKNLLTQPNIRRLEESLAEAAGTEKGILSERAREEARERAYEIVLLAGGKICASRGVAGLVLEYLGFVRFINMNRKTIHKFVFIPEPYEHGEHRRIYMIPSEVAEKILVLGWPKPTDD